MAIYFIKVKTTILVGEKEVVSYISDLVEADSAFSAEEKFESKYCFDYYEVLYEQFNRVDD